MRLKLSGALCLLTVTITAYAQKSGVYIEGSVNFSNITISDENNKRRVLSFSVGFGL